MREQSMGQRVTVDWFRTRAAVLDRDGWKCRHCGHPVHPRCNPRGCDRCAHVDHLIPLAFGGDNRPSNLVAACRRCNLGRGATGRDVVPKVRSRVW